VLYAHTHAHTHNIHKRRDRFAEVYYNIYVQYTMVYMHTILYRSGSLRRWPPETSLTHSPRAIVWAPCFFPRHLLTPFQPSDPPSQNLPNRFTDNHSKVILLYIIKQYHSTYTAVEQCVCVRVCVCVCFYLITKYVGQPPPHYNTTAAPVAVEHDVPTQPTTHHFISPICI
jgi:hypothetical protein